MNEVASGPPSSTASYIYYSLVLTLASIYNLQDSRKFQLPSSVLVLHSVSVLYFVSNVLNPMSKTYMLSLASSEGL